MNALVCLTVADANAYRAAIRAQLGYPKAGIDIGGGYHQPGGGVTTDYGATIPHPTLSTAVFYPYDATVQAQPVATPAGSVVQVFDPVVWLPTPLQGQIG